LPDDLGRVRAGPAAVRSGSVLQPAVQVGEVSFGLGGAFLGCLPGCLAMESAYLVEMMRAPAERVWAPQTRA
jgi:hypothetical protein